MSERLASDQSGINQSHPIRKRDAHVKGVVNSVYVRFPHDASGGPPPLLLSSELRSRIPEEAS